jgi:EAL domain-containing protein (putative c-di-GMP-specific phosphodiesterase class I)
VSDDVEAIRPRLRNTLALPLLAVAALAGVSVLRFVINGAPGEELLAVVPIALLGVMFGPRGGLLAALCASAVFLAWAAGHDVSTLDYVDEPLAFFTLGLVAGFYAHGALGDYDLERHRLRRRLLRAIERGEIVMHYQPVVDVARGVPLAVEALARWQVPGDRLIAPAAFIPAAERDPSTIQALTLYTFEQAASYASERLADTSIPVAVNLSAAVLESHRVPHEIGRILRRTGLAPERLYIEITETAFAEEEATVAAAIERLKELGVGMVLLDDFGVGQSSLARLGSFQIDALKIDIELIRNLRRPEYQAVVRSIVELAHALGLTVVAEGVEDAHTDDELREMGCDALQGFHLSPPLPGEDVDLWLSRAGGPAQSAP